MPTSLTPLEKCVIEAIAEQLSQQDSHNLTSQINGATIKSRENTGVGFFTYFNLDRDPQYKIATNTRDCRVQAKIAGMSYGMGFILWLDDGFVCNLEGYTFEPNSTVGMDLETVSFDLVPEAKLHSVRNI